MRASDYSLLFRTAWILLQRPFCRRQAFPARSQAAQQACIARSTEMHLLFCLHSKTFGLRNLTYLVAYMAYVAATVDLSEALHGDPGSSVLAQTRLSLTLRVLTHAAEHTPGIQRSISQLRQRLQGQQTAAFGAASGTATPTTAHPPASLAPLGDRLASALFSSRDSFGGTDANLNPTLGLEFQDLFDVLLPEYTTQSMTSEAFDTSTAFLPFDDLMWFENITNA